MLLCMTTRLRDAVSSPEKVSDRTRRVTVSDETPDRYNTTFAADGWETRNFDANPVLLWCHQASALPLGKAKVSRDGKRLVADAEFFGDDVNPDSSRVLRMIDLGILAVSHRFEPIEEEYNATREKGDWRDWVYPPIDYKRQELLEISIVTVPGNANALPERAAVSKSISAITDPAELRLLTSGAFLRAAGSGAEPSPTEVERIKNLRAIAMKKRADADEKKPDESKEKTDESKDKPQAKPAETATADDAPPKEDEAERAEGDDADADSEEVELPEGVTPEDVAQLVKDTVLEVLEQRSRTADLRRRGELEVA